MSDKLPRKQNRQPLPAARPDPGPTAGVPTPELCDRICAGIAKGLHPHVAAELAGVSARMFESWIEEGKKGIEPYATLRTAIAHAAPPSPQRDDAAFHAAFSINIHVSHEEDDGGPICNLNHSHGRSCYGLPEAVILPEYTNVTSEPEQPPRDRSSIHTRTDDLNAEIRGRGLIFPLRPEKKRPENGGNGDPEDWN